MITNVAGMVIPCMLSRRTFLWRSAPPFPRPFHPLPRQGITEACNKGLKSYYALSDLVSKFLNPKTLSHLYKTVVCLLLYLDVNSETAYPLLISRNSIPSSTSYVRMHWISQNYVDLTFVNLFWRSTNRCRNWLQKLLFFGRLCRLSSNALTKKIFLTPLYAFLYDLARTQFGFIPEILQILHLYGITNYLQSWLQDGSFPDKPAWKKIVRTSVSSQQNYSAMTVYLATLTYFFIVQFSAI